MRVGLPAARGHRRLLGALSIDALGTGLFLPFSLLYFTATTDLSLSRIGLALSIAAFIRIPATAVAGMFCDRFGARSTVIASNIAQAVGFANYLLVGSFGHLLAAAIVVQVGNSAFWVAYPALVHDVADGAHQESWFAVITALRNAGLAVGGLGASLAVALGGTTGYTAIVGINAVSFVVAAVLTRLDRSGQRRPSGNEPAEAESPGRWSIPLRDRPFLGYVVLNVGLALLSLAFAVGVPVFLVTQVDLPQWIPGTVLAVNAVLAAAGATPIVGVIAGRRRSRTLVSSQAIIAAGFLAVLGCAYVSTAVGVVLALVSCVLVTTTELVQGLVVPAIVNESATGSSRGRYNSLYQLAFSVGDIVTPALMTALLAHGAAATWLPLVALAILNAFGVLLLTPRMPALARRIARPVPTGAESGRALEADGL